MAAEHGTDQLLINKHEAAKMTGISARSLDRLVSTGRFLRPIRLGGRVLWHRKELEAWVAAGCPRPEHVHEGGRR